MNGDLISRSALLEENMYGNTAPIAHRTYAERLIQNAPAVDAGPKWISVEERLPELIPCNAGTAYSEAVIVWTNGRKAMVAVWDGSDFLCAADYWEAWGEKITHWMPLPELPKEV